GRVGGEGIEAVTSRDSAGPLGRLPQLTVRAERQSRIRRAFFGSAEKVSTAAAVRTSVSPESLKKDPEGQIRWATAPEQIDCDVEINIVSHRKSTSCARLVPHSLELFRPPPLDALHLGGICQGDVSDRHAVLSRRLPSLFGQ